MCWWWICRIQFLGGARSLFCEKLAILPWSKVEYFMHPPVPSPSRREREARHPETLLLGRMALKPYSRKGCPSVWRCLLLGQLTEGPRQNCSLNLSMPISSLSSDVLTQIQVAAVSHWSMCQMRPAGFWCLMPLCTLTLHTSPLRCISWMGCIGSALGSDAALFR